MSVSLRTRAAIVAFLLSVIVVSGVAEYAKTAYQRLHAHEASALYDQR